jgi:putative toxin-antitoxin system antitoxin component (TIGR02293 family)
MAVGGAAALAMWHNDNCHVAGSAGGAVSGTADIVRALGGPRLVPARSPGQLRALVRAGLPYAALSAVVSGFGLGAGDAVTILRIPERTLARRRKEKRLSADESDRLVRLARIAALAEEVLGSRDKAARWLVAENRALGGRAPLSELDTDLGAEEIETVLQRLAHGIVG